jgi:hypothetical protein
MAGDNKGFLYEEKINSLLKKNKLQSPSFTGAGSDPNAPDAEITIEGKDYKVEVKLDTKVDFGQGSLDYDLKKKKWILGGAKTGSAEQMREFLTAVGVLKIVNKEWPKTPRKFTVSPKFYTPEDVKYDYSNFKDKFVNIPGNAVSNYYNSKKTYYIQIGQSGLYYMGSDPAKIGCPQFTLGLKLRIRLKRGGSNPIYNYRFTTAIQALSGTLKQSQYDLEDVELLKSLAGRKK